jgi:hypothetical protein
MAKLGFAFHEFRWAKPHRGKQTLDASAKHSRRRPTFVGGHDGESENLL